MDWLTKYSKMKKTFDDILENEISTSANGTFHITTKGIEALATITQEAEKKLLIQPTSFLIQPASLKSNISSTTLAANCWSKFKRRLVFSSRKNCYYTGFFHGYAHGAEAAIKLEKQRRIKNGQSEE